MCADTTSVPNPMTAPGMREGDTSLVQGGSYEIEEKTTERMSVPPNLKLKGCGIACRMWWMVPTTLPVGQETLRET